MDDHAKSAQDADAEQSVLRLADAGDQMSAWITLLTTEQYNLQTQRAATITESNGRASIFLGAVSAGLIALGFRGIGSGRSTGTTVFAVVVLTSLAFLGVVTFLRCLEIAIDDWQFSARINKLRTVYTQLVPDLAGLLPLAAGVEQSTSMLTQRRQRFQMMLSVAGTIGIITSILLGADVGVLAYGLHVTTGIALVLGVLTGAGFAKISITFHRARWAGATGLPVTSDDLTIG